MKMRLQKLLSERGVASRRKAEEIILAGRVSCNGQICALGESVDPDTDQILLDGKPLPSGGALVYIMLHKPRGFVTTLSDEKGRKTAAMLVSDCGQRVYPVGRLDMDSEGLLLFTNDGEFANRLMHPKHEVDKTYHVIVSGCTEEAVEKLKRSVVLDGYRIKTPQVRVLQHTQGENAARLEVVIHEGRNRQVRRMCDLAGMKVRRLIRVAEGPVKLADLPKGKWRYLTREEILALNK